jgi:CspA family cold shock protein
MGTTTNTGTVKFFNESKNYGFITDKVSGKDVFVHASGTLDHLVKDDEVAFNLITGDRGLKCVDVKRVKK